MSKQDAPGQTYPNLFPSSYKIAERYDYPIDGFPSEDKLDHSLSLLMSKYQDNYLEFILAL